jgi:hypothetical protein
MGQGPYNVFVGGLSASDSSGSAVTTNTYGTIDLGDVRDKFTLAVGLTGASFSPSFATDLAAYVLAEEDNPGYSGGEPVPVPVGELSVVLQGSLDGFSWYTLTTANAALATPDGTNITAVPTVTEVISGAPSPLARYIQAIVTLTLEGNENLTYGSGAGRPFYSANPIVTSLSLSQVSIWVAASHEV